MTKYLVGIVSGLALVGAGLLIRNDSPIAMGFLCAGGALTVMWTVGEMSGAKLG